jgi:hypothetical protein
MLDQITRFAGDRIKDLQNVGDVIGNELEYGAKVIRDQVIVPAIDTGMEAGAIPGKEGMFIRYLSGTSKPLNKMPADVKRDEADLNQKRIYDDPHRFLNSNTPNASQIVDLNNRWLNLTSSNKQKREMHNIHGIGELPTEAEINNEQQLNLQLDNISNQTGVDRVRLNTFNNPAYDPRNHTTNYDENNKGHDSLYHALGRYRMKDGVINDRYDFNEYMNPGDTWSRKRNGPAVYHAGRLADHLGLIEPGSGYDVRFKVR